MADKPTTEKAAVTISAIEPLTNSEKIVKVSYHPQGMPNFTTDAKAWKGDLDKLGIKVGADIEIETYMKPPGDPKYSAERWIWSEYAGGGKGGGRGWTPKSPSERAEQAAISALGCATAFAKDSGSQDFDTVIENAKRGLRFIIQAGKAAEKAPAVAPAEPVKVNPPAATATDDDDDPFADE